MGKYLNRTSLRQVGATAQDKCNAILEDGAEEILEPELFLENIVCVVDNGVFGAAAYIFSQDELNVFTQSDDRKKRWFIYDKVKEFAH